MTSTPTISAGACSIVRPTTIIESSRLNQSLGARIIIASETFQETGSFKLRAAYRVACSVPHHLLITASSGNFGQALAYSCALIGKSSIVVMPSTAAQVKIDAVREYGAQVELIDTRSISRKERVAAIAAANPDAYVASSSDDPLVIAGNSSLGRELSAFAGWFDLIVAPIGGGGLTSGLIAGLERAGAKIPVLAAEPLLANDAAQSLREGRIVTLPGEPATIADGARVLSVGRHNWPLLRGGLAGVIEVPEDAIAKAVALLFAEATLKVEPTGALAVAAVLSHPEKFERKTVCCVVSGGNVDPTTYARLIGHTVN